MVRRCSTLGFALLLAACEPMEGSGDVFRPVSVKATTPEAAPVPAPGASPAPAPGGFDFDADARIDEPVADGADGSGGLSPSDVMKGFGLTPGPAPEPEPIAPAPEPEPVPEPEPAPVATWTPGTPLDGSFGIRLVSTTAEAQPPRAILGLADGTEAVVQPGTLLPDARIVVLAIGRDVVQIATVTPAGDHARVETRELTAMYRRPTPEP